MIAGETSSIVSPADTLGRGSFGVLASDSAATILPADSIAIDSLALERPEEWGLMLEAPVKAEPLSPVPDSGASWAVVALMLLFCIVAFRFRSTSRFLTSMIADLTEVRERSSIFDTTVRETSMMTLLCLLTICSGGILLATAVGRSGVNPGIPLLSDMPPRLGTYTLCTIIVGIYMLFLALAYRLVGYVFGDLVKTRLWVQGYGASMSLLGLLWLPCALLAIARPDWSAPVLLTAGIGFILAKITFIFKGFRIFFTRVSSWVLFLYYLCSLEAVPILLAFAAATNY